MGVYCTMWEAHGLEIDIAGGTLPHSLTLRSCLRVEYYTVYDLNVCSINTHYHRFGCGSRRTTQPQYRKADTKHR